MEQHDKISNTTLKQLIEDTNKHITDNTNIKNGRAEKHTDFFDDNRVRVEIIEMMDGHDLNKHIPYTDRGNTIYLKNAGITLFLKRKRTHLSYAHFNSDGAMRVVEVTIKEDLNNLADKTLDEILDFINAKKLKSEEISNKRKEKEIDEFEEIIDEFDITLEQFYQMRNHYQGMGQHAIDYFNEVVKV